MHVLPISHPCCLADRFFLEPRALAGNSNHSPAAHPQIFMNKANNEFHAAPVEPLCPLFRAGWVMASMRLLNFRAGFAPPCLVGKTLESKAPVRGSEKTLSAVVTSHEVSIVRISAVPFLQVTFLIFTGQWLCKLN